MFGQKMLLVGVKAADSSSVVPTVFPKLGTGDPRTSVRGGGDEDLNKNRKRFSLRCHSSTESENI